MDKQLIGHFISVAIIIIGAITFFAMIKFDLTPVKNSHVEKIVDIEGFSSMEEGFCKSHEGDQNKLNESCGTLQKDNCLATSCCVYAKMNGDTKCYAGDKNGPTFRRNSDGKTYDIDYYYFRNKCFGKDCPKE